MSRTGVALATLLAALSLIAITVSSANAAWFIEGKELAFGSKEALATTATVDTSIKLNLPVQKVKLECGASLVKAETPEILGESGIEAKKLTFENCKTIEPSSGCALEGSTIPSQPVEASATVGTSAPDVKLLFLPRTKNLLAEIPFEEKNTCAFAGKEPVRGKVVADAPNLQEELVNQPIDGLGSTENNSLEVGAGNKAFIEGKTLLKLSSGLKFAAAPIMRWGLVLGAGKVENVVDLKFLAPKEKVEVVLFNQGNVNTEVEEVKIRT